MVARNEDMPQQKKDIKDDVTESDEAFADTIVWETKAKSTDNVGEASVELDVESLVAEIEAEAGDGVDASGRVRRRLEALLERKRRHEAFADFEDYDLDS